MKVTHDGLQFCEDCMVIQVNGHSDTTTEAQDKASNDGIERLSKLGHLVPSFDTEDGKGYNEFSWRQCACCHSNLGGARYEFIILGEETAVV